MAPGACSSNDPEGKAIGSQTLLSTRVSLRVPKGIMTDQTFTLVLKCVSSFLAQGPCICCILCLQYTFVRPLALRIRINAISIDCSSLPTPLGLISDRLRVPRGLCKSCYLSTLQTILCTQKSTDKKPSNTCRSQD